jgi:hypothetical protein
VADASQETRTARPSLTAIIDDESVEGPSPYARDYLSRPRYPESRALAAVRFDALAEVSPMLE